MTVLIHGREWLINTIMESITNVDGAMETLKRKRAIADSARAMTMSKLKQRRAMLMWTKKQADTMPETININELGEDVTP